MVSEMHRDDSKHGSLQMVSGSLLVCPGHSQEFRLAKESPRHRHRQWPPAVVGFGMADGETDRWMPREVGDLKVIASDIEVNRLHHGGHVLHEQCPQSIGAEIIDGGGETRFAESDRPKSDPLADPFTRQFLERASRLGSQDQ